MLSFSSEFLLFFSASSCSLQADFQAGVKRHQALLAQQKVLNETLEKMSSYHARLETADKRHDLQDLLEAIDGEDNSR